MKTAREMMKSGEVYICTDPELMKEQPRRMEILYDFNHTRPSEKERRKEILRSFLAEMGSGCWIEPPFHANWGTGTHLGNNVYANFNLTLVDDTDIYIGNDVMIGPNVTITTAGHPVDPELRRKTAQFNLPVRIGNNVWIGAGAIILPGVTVGENSVIGAGSVVSRDIPPDVVAFGVPCRVQRRIGDRDREFYYRDLRIDPAWFSGN